MAKPYENLLEIQIARMVFATFIFGFEHTRIEMAHTKQTEVHVSLNLLELSFLLHSVWEPAKHGDTIARALFQKIRGAIIAAGIEWRYGRPW
jgi:hypothetical protein